MENTIYVKLLIVPISWSLYFQFPLPTISFLFYFWKIPTFLAGKPLTTSCRKLSSISISESGITLLASQKPIKRQGWWRRKSALFWMLATWGDLCIQMGYIFPFLLCFSLLFFSKLFVRPPQTAILLFCISFTWGWSWPLSSVQYHELPSVVHQACCLSDLVP